MTPLLEAVLKSWASEDTVNTVLVFLAQGVKRGHMTQEQFAEISQWFKDNPQ